MFGTGSSDDFDGMTHSKSPFLKSRAKLAIFGVCDTGRDNFSEDLEF